LMQKEFLLNQMNVFHKSRRKREKNMKKTIMSKIQEAILTIRKIIMAIYKFTVKLKKLNSK